MTGHRVQRARSGASPSTRRPPTYAFDGELVKLASNETPVRAAPAGARGRRGARCARSTATRTRERQRCASALSERYRRAAGRASRSATARASILLAAAEAMLEPGAEIVYAWPSFSMYPQLAAMSGARAIDRAAERCRRARPRRDGARGHGRHAHRDRLQPEQPDRHRAAARRRSTSSSARLPRHVAVILDEAYVEFSSLQDPDESLDLLERHPNLVLLRTFSKVYGLCGLRVGYALGSEDFRLAVDRVRQPFSVNALAQAAATEALKPPGRGRAARGADGDRAPARGVGARTSAA